MGICREMRLDSAGGRRAVFFDRDGVINRSVVHEGKPYPPRDLDEFVYMDGVRETLVELKTRDFLLFIVTNQPDVERRTTTVGNVEELHGRILDDLPVDRIYACYHDDCDDCACRKPKPGFLFQAQREFGLDLRASFLVGDRWRDIDAGNAAGCTTIFIDHGYDESLKTRPTYVVTEVTAILTCISASSVQSVVSGTAT